MHDLVIRDGKLIDGTGNTARSGDVAIRDGRITEVGKVAGPARRTIHAGGRLVTPGFVDIHTHYDAQVTWDPQLLPTGWHGVTTTVFGNCGVGFAPARADRREWLIQLMEGVEDIPGTALSQGIRWGWETFPEYLDAIEATPLAIDCGTHVPHGAVRAYVMGERGARNEPARGDDIEAMYRIVREGLEAGALGFSTSRTRSHRARDGEPVPGTLADEEELFGIGRALKDSGLGVFEVAGAGTAGDSALDGADDALEEIQWMHRLSAYMGRPVSFAVLQFGSRPNQWRELIEICRKTRSDGANVVAQYAARPFGILAGHQTEANPFLNRPAYAATANAPLAERVAKLRDPAVRAAILGPDRVDRPNLFAALLDMPEVLAHVFLLGDPPNYEPSPDSSVAAIAQREGRPADHVLYDFMLRDEGRELLLVALMNYSDGDLNWAHTMMHSEDTILSLGDGGAHCGVICDASLPTFMLTHWSRDRTRGAKVPVELAVKRMTSDTARLYGLNDRGQLAPGYKADVNVIDFDALRLCRPEMAFDLPGGARRLLQRAHGYDHKIVSGTVVMEGGEPTGRLPGRLVRGPQPPPAG